MTTDDLTTDDTQDDNQPSRLRAKLEEEAKARRSAESRLADLERKEAFRDAGLDLKKPLHQALAKSYDGELNVEDIKAYVDGLGISDSPPAQRDPEVPEQDAMDRIAAASAGADPEGPPPDAREAFYKELRELTERGLTKGGRQTMTQQERFEQVTALAQKYNVPFNVSHSG